MKHFNLGDSWRHIISKSDGELEEWVKTSDFDSLFDRYHNMFNTWNWIRAELYKYEEARNKIEKLGGYVQWDKETMIYLEVLSTDEKFYRSTLNKINEFTVKHHK